MITFQDIRPLVQLEASELASLAIGTVDLEDTSVQLRIVLADFLKRAGHAWPAVMLIDRLFQSMLPDYMDGFQRALTKASVIRDIPAAYLELIDNRWAQIRTSDRTSRILDLTDGQDADTIPLPGWALSCSIVCIWIRTLARFCFPELPEAFEAGRIKLVRSV